MSDVEVCDPTGQKGNASIVYLGFLALPFIVFLAILNWPVLGNHAITLSTELLPASGIASANEAANRYDLFSFTVMLVVAAICLLIYATVLLFRTFGQVRSRLLIAGAALAAATVIAMAATPNFSRGAQSGPAAAIAVQYPNSKFRIVAPELFDNTLGAIELFPGAQTKLLDLLDCITNLANYTVALAAIAVALASCAQIMMPAGVATGDLARARFYAERMKILNRLLQGSAVVLVLGILQARQWLLWPAAFLDEEARKTYEALATSYLTIEGLLYTLLLAAIYVPAALILHLRIETEFESVPDQTGKTEWLEKVGWPTPGWETAKSFVPILMPLLAGPVTSAATDVISLLWA